MMMPMLVLMTPLQFKQNKQIKRLQLKRLLPLKLQQPKLQQRKPQLKRLLLNLKQLLQLKKPRPQQPLLRRLLLRNPQKNQLILLSQPSFRKQLKMLLMMMSKELSLNLLPFRLRWKLT